MIQKNKPKIIAVVGPTATGKSDLAVAIAQAFNGEVISTDSRQVYKGLDIGTGKITKEEMQGIPHHLLDIADPTEVVSVATYKKQADEIIKDIHTRGKLPILAGGAGMYTDAVAYGITYPEVPPNEVLREKLEQETPEELFDILRKKDPKRSEVIDPQNKRRLVRALEIIETLGKVPEATQTNPYDVCIIGIDLPDEMLRERITTRLERRMNAGMLEEAKLLHKSGLTFKRMDELGLEYRYLALLLQNQITHEEFMRDLATAIWRYAKRQRMWFKRNKDVVWFEPSEREEILEVVRKFI